MSLVQQFVLVIPIYSRISNVSYCSLYGRVTSMLGELSGPVVLANPMMGGQVTRFPYPGLFHISRRFHSAVTKRPSRGSLAMSVDRGEFAMSMLSDLGVRNGNTMRP